MLGVALVLLQICLICQLAGAWRNFDIVFHNVSCAFPMKGVERVQCLLKPNNRTVPEFFMGVKLCEDVYPVKLHVLVHFNANGHQFTMLDVKLNTCEMLRATVNNTSVNLIVGLLRDKRYSNFPEQCPLRKNIEYYVRNLWLDADQYPPFTLFFKFNNTNIFHDAEGGSGRFELLGEFRQKDRKSNNKQKKRLRGSG